MLDYKSIKVCLLVCKVLIPEGNRWIAGSAVTVTEQIPCDPVIGKLLKKYLKEIFDKGDMRHAKLSFTYRIPSGVVV